jgi:hypothetical protein
MVLDSLMLQPTSHQSQTHRSNSGGDNGHQSSVCDPRAAASATAPEV